MSNKHKMSNEVLSLLFMKHNETPYKSDIGIPISDLLTDTMEIVFGSVPYDNHIGYCELTTEMDQYLIYDYRRERKRYTYVYEFSNKSNTSTCNGKEGYGYILRYPGASCGCIYTDENNIIQAIDFYEFDCYNCPAPQYKRKMDNIKSKYIGKRIVVKHINE